MGTNRTNDTQLSALLAKPHQKSAGYGTRKPCCQNNVCCGSAGAQEDQQGVPFVGPAGRVLDVLLTSIQLKRQDIYLTNIVKCHPPANRDPSPAEQEACLPFLKCETLLLHPPIIVCLGRIAAQKLIAPQYKISRQHGTWIFRKGYWMTAVYHPSAILRDPSKLEETKQDFQTILRKLQELEDQAYPPLI